jgi:hypothetical protein
MDARSLKWGSILFGVGIGLFLPRALRRHGRFIALVVGPFAIHRLLAMLREDRLICNDRPVFAGASSTGAATPTSLEGAESAD